MKHTDETKHKLSEMRKGKNNPFYGHKHSKETREKLSANLRIYRENRTYDIIPSTINIPTIEKLAYIAGIIDGEGSIGFHKKAPHISIYNNDKNLMEWLVKNVGGTYRVTDLRGRSVGYTWTIQSTQNVYKLLKSIIPFLIIRIERANLVITELKEKYGKKLED